LRWLEVFTIDPPLRTGRLTAVKGASAY